MESLKLPQPAIHKRSQSTPTLNNPPDADLTNLEFKTQNPTVRPCAPSIVKKLQRFDQNYRLEYQVPDTVPSGNAGSR